MSYVQLDYRPGENDLVCEFYIEPAKGYTVRKAALHVASESSVGTWTEVSTMKESIRKLGAKVFEIKGNNVRIAYPEELFEKGNVPQIMSSIAGNIFGMKAVRNLRLKDIVFTKDLVRFFPGPLIGIKGVRRLLNVHKRPLLGTIVKPKLGLDEHEHAKVAYDAWTGGLDIVKDDENLSNQSFNKFENRVTETLKLRDKAEHETGERKMYMPNVTAETSEMLKRAKFVKDHGGEYAMVDIVSVGWSALETLREENEGLKLILHAHRAGHGAFTRSKKHGISMLVLARLTRLVGMDQLHIGTADVGKMVQEDDVTKLEDVLTCDWHGLLKTFPVASGGLHPGMISELVERMGMDIIAQFGGGCHGHPLGTRAGARAIRQAVEATMQGIDLNEYAKNNDELRLALKKWPK